MRLSISNHDAFFSTVCTHVKFHIMFKYSGFAHLYISNAYFYMCGTYTCDSFVNIGSVVVTDMYQKFIITAVFQ